MGSELGDSLYIKLPCVTSDWIKAHAVEFWIGGVSAFRSIAAESWGDAFEKHYCRLRDEQPLRFAAVSDWCNGAVVVEVVDIGTVHFEGACLFGVSIETAEQTKTFNETVRAIFHTIATAIADEWAGYFGINLEK